MIDTNSAPARVGLCPSPSHYGEFYVPLDADERAVCPAEGCKCELIVYSISRPPTEPVPEGGWPVGQRVLVDGLYTGSVMPQTMLAKQMRADYCAVKFTHGGTEVVALKRITRDRRSAERRR